MININNIEAGDKCYTRDGGCLVARLSNTGDVVLGSSLISNWTYTGEWITHGKTHALDIIRIEKTPKPV